MSRLIDADALWFEIIHYMNYCDDILELIEKNANSTAVDTMQ